MTTTPSPGLKTVAVLRSNPRDAALGRLLATLGARYRLECLLWDRTGDFEPTFRSERTTYRRFGLRSGFHDAATLAKLALFQLWLFARLMRTRCDVVHAIDLDTALPGMLAARLRGRRFVYHCLDPYYAALPRGWPPVLGRIARALENRVISGADLFVVTDLLRMPQHAGARPRRVVELPNVPDLPAPAAPRARRADGRLRVGYVGSLVEGRNLATIVEACAELRDQGVELVLGGFGPLHDDVAARCAGHANVTFTSWIPSYADLLALEGTFDVFLHVTDPELPSQRWVSPNKLFTSMAYGRPIVVGEGTLAAERVRAFGNGVAVPYGSKEALQRALLALRDRPERAEEMGRSGRAEFQRSWTPEAVGARLLDAYASVAPAQRAAASPG